MSSFHFDEMVRHSGREQLIKIWFACWPVSVISENTFWGHFSPHQHLLQKDVICVWLKHPSPLHNPGNDDGFWGLWVGWASFAHPLLCAVEVGGPVISIAVWETPRETSLLFAAVLAGEGSRACIAFPCLAYSDYTYLSCSLTVIVKTFPFTGIK